MGYHKKEIKRGTFGEFSKIVEEFEELVDANEQKIKIMELIEMSDLLGAMEEYIKINYNMTLTDLSMMKNATKKAFMDGSRK